MSQFHKLSIKDIYKETDKSVTLSFDVPYHLKDTFIFNAGQYITLKTVITPYFITVDYSF